MDVDGERERTLGLCVCVRLTLHSEVKRGFLNFDFVLSGSVDVNGDLPLSHFENYERRGRKPVRKV